MNALRRLFNEKPQILPRWVILGIDACLALIALAFAYQVRFEFEPPADEMVLARSFLPVFIGVRVIAFLWAKSHAGIIRFSGTADARRVLIALASGTGVLAALNVGAGLAQRPYPAPFSVLAIELIASLLLLIGFRVVTRSVYQRFQTRRATDVIIFGAGEAGLITRQAIERPSEDAMRVVAFLDDDPSKVGKWIEGVPVYSADRLTEVLGWVSAERMIVAIEHVELERKSRLIDEALACGLRVMDVPPAQRWIQGALSSRQIRDVRIEDLLGRPTIELDDNHVRECLDGTCILVTGGAGSIGSELVRQALRSGAGAVWAVDTAETPLHDLTLSVRAEFGLDTERFRAVIADVKDPRAMQDVMAQSKPDLVYHAAAYKHVPVMEMQAAEAWRTNVLGTATVAEAALSSGVRTFVLISTDKAVNPSSVMGASKRAAELVVRALCENSPMRRVITRFGNVLGSNGSVIPLFKRQIEQGGPVTITHEDVTRFFMTIPEAVRLVLEASATSDGDDIFVFDMGERIRIIDLARRMIRLAGRVEGQDIELKVIGMRPGEKLHEELIHEAEGLLPTRHPKILRARPSKIDPSEILKTVNEDRQGYISDGKAIERMHDLVPEYHGENLRTLHPLKSESTNT
ncbi:MAG: nucleoside-diphosphate sugar epimerase/dehydratase [Flavobacteriales bacterium]|nr:nucleoside-diphosphate sugar epimerase/dehydratase [Flavobacteriales bacterium]